MKLLTLPRGTKRVIARLRRDVRHRPDERQLRRDDVGAGWPTIDGQLCCPLGLLPSAKYHRPTFVDLTECAELTDEEFRRFVRWWDNLTLAQARKAVGLIWPKKKIARKRGGRA